MHVINHTPFPTLRLEGENQHGQAFHVLVLRQTLSFASGLLEYADEQAPLCDSDIFFGELNASSLRQESDLCQFKPRCDVIVNATAHAPGGKATRRFPARLVLCRPSIYIKSIKNIENSKMASELLDQLLIILTSQREINWRRGIHVAAMELKKLRWNTQLRRF